VGITIYRWSTNEIAGRETEVLTIGADRRIQSDYQFIDP